MASFHKVKKLLKFKSAANLHFPMGGAIDRARPNEISHQNAAFSIAECKFAADLNFKSFITSLKLAIGP